MCLILRESFGNTHRTEKTHGGTVSVPRWGLLVLLVAGMLGGCSEYHVDLHPRSPGPTPLSNTPIPTDPAMEMRQWDVSEALYVNDAVFAHPIYSPLQVDQFRYEGNSVIEPVLFLADVIYIPFGMFIQYPWTYEVSKSLSAAPSYTLMPPLPEGAQPISRY